MGQEERLRRKRLPCPSRRALAVPSLLGRGTAPHRKVQGGCGDLVLVSVSGWHLHFLPGCPGHTLEVLVPVSGQDPGAGLFTDGPGLLCWWSHCRLKQVCLQRVKTRSGVPCGRVLMSGAQSVSLNAVGLSRCPAWSVLGQSPVSLTSQATHRRCGSWKVHGIVSALGSLSFNSPAKNDFLKLVIPA